MIIKKQDQNKLIQELLPQLLEVNEQSVAYSRMKGEDMIAQGQTHIGKSTVDPRGNYTVSRVVFLKVNHEKRMKKLIRDAKNYEDMTSRLGAYLRQYGTKFQNTDNSPKPNPEHGQPNKNIL